MTTPITPAPQTRLSDLYQSDPVLRERVAAQKKEAETAIHALKQSRVDLNDQKKSYAMQTIQRIKASIAALKLSGLIDSKTLGRMAARLARELAGAVKDFIAAGGKPDLVNFTSDMAKTSTEISAAGASHEESSENFLKSVDAEIKAALGKYQAAQNISVATEDKNRAFADLARSTIEELRKILRGHKQIHDALGRREDPEFGKAEDALREAERAISRA